jgi:hypothetical protein
MQAKCPPIMYMNALGAKLGLTNCDATFSTCAARGAASRRRAPLMRRPAQRHRQQHRGHDRSMPAGRPQPLVPGASADLPLRAHLQRG